MVQILFFGIVLEDFSQFLIYFCCQQTMMSDIFTHYPTIKKLPAALCVHILQLLQPS